MNRQAMNRQDAELAKTRRPLGVLGALAVGRGRGYRVPPRADARRLA